MTMEAIIYIAHGSRLDSANERFITFIKEVMERSDAQIQAYGFIEHAEPSIAEAIGACMKEGASEITVVPILLLPGIHANEDIPAVFKDFPDVVFHYSKPLGVDEILIQLLSDRLTMAGFSYRDNETVLLVGHGSREPQAAIEFELLARLLRRKIGTEVHIAYLTTPTFYHEKVKELIDKKVYVLPYLLFSGGYTVKMEKVLGEVDGQVWLCPPIGFDEKLIPLIQKRANEVCAHEFKLSDYVTA
jgi:sirohydrochlorin ferrochelatase